jgi:hypothetical protein
LDLRLDCLSDVSHLDLSLLFLVHSRGVDRAEQRVGEGRWRRVLRGKGAYSAGLARIEPLDGGVRAISAYDLLGLACAVAVPIDLR